MATSDSDDFESADEELVARSTPQRKISSQWQNTNSAIDSESDDDNECMQPVSKTNNWNSGNRSVQSSGQERRARTSVSSVESSNLDSGAKPENQAKATLEEAMEKPTLKIKEKDTKNAEESLKKITETTKSSTKPVNQAKAKATPTEAGEKKTNLESKKKDTKNAGESSKNISEIKKSSAKPVDREKVDAKANPNEAGEKKTTLESKKKDTKNAEESSKNISDVTKSSAKPVDQEEVDAKATAKEGAKKKSTSKSKEIGADNANECDDVKQISSTEAGLEIAPPDVQIEKKDEEEKEEKSGSEVPSGRKERIQRQRKPKESKSLGAKKLGAKVETAPKPPPMDARTPDEIRRKAIAEGKEPPIIEECWEFNEEETAKILKGMKDFGLGEGDRVKMPEELKSDKKFKEIFKPDGWEDLDDEEILAELDDKRVLPVLDRIASASEESSNSGWGGWGSWGSSLINSATAGVSTLTSHVTHGLELLDQAVGAPHPEELAKTDKVDDSDSIDDKSSSSQEVQPQLSFGFNDLISGVSSITRLVESTGTKVITGGLGTLETIGKKTMEVLQEGDPGLKKKRAFFLNESDKPILSQMLREAKEKADVEEKTLEEKQLTRKVHFESLFDDFQGLVHLEALEMLSRQCNIKIQQRLVTLDADELTSIQETLEEVKELCDLGDEDDEEENDDNLQERLKSTCKDLGVAITYEKLQDIWKDTRTYMSEVSTPESTVTEREVFQRAISTLARFTAFSVERFHKTAELLLIKERRSTVNEADALVQLTRILSGQIGIAANLFSNWLNERMKNAEKTDSKVDITTIFLEAANASSYVQDAFRLLIPILQVGAI